MADAKTIIAARAGRELKDGQIINLGIGLPTLIANYVPEGVDVVIQTENGAIGVGPAPAPGCEDRDRANAGNQPITLIPGRQLLRLRDVVRDDPRRPHRRHLPRHAAGRREGQHRQLDRARQDAGRHGRRHGPGDRRQDRLHRQRALRQRRQLQAHEAVHLPAHRRRGMRRDHHRARAVPPLPGQGFRARRSSRGLHPGRHRRLHRHGLHGRRRRQAGRLRRPQARGLARPAGRAATP